MPVIDLDRFPPRRDRWPYAPGHSHKAEYDARVVACAEVVAVMCYPDSEKNRRDFLRNIKAYTTAMAFEDDPPLPTSMAEKDTLTALTEGHGLPEALRKAATSVYGGFVSGHILLFILRCAEFSPNDVSVLKAVFVMERKLVRDSRRFMRQGGRAIAANRTTIMNAWSTFKPAAHFWAATVLWEREGRLTDWFDLLFSVKDLLAFIALAEVLRHRSEVLYAHGQERLGKPVLDPSVTWRASDRLALPDLQVTLPRLTDLEKGLLKEYRAK